VTPVLDRAWRGLGLLLHGVALVGALVLAAMLVGIAADVVLRNAAGSGVRGIVEYTEFGLYLSTVLAAPWLLHRGSHIRADILTTVLPPRAANVVDALGDALGAAVCAAVGWYAFRAMEQSRGLGSMVRRTVTFPEWWLSAPLVPAMALLALVFLLRLARVVARPGERREDARSIA
jgi:TRAP-type C4-dicarboxylate transport system permease small subunit